MFLTYLNGLNNLGRGSPKNISQNYMEIGSVVQWFLTRRVFFLSFLYRYKGKISPAPLAAMFLTNPNGLNNLCRGSSKEQFCKIILKSVQWFLTRRFLKFSTQIYRKNKPRPLAAMFSDESKWLEQSWQRITKGTFLQNYMEIGPVVSNKKIFLSFLYRYIGKRSPVPWWPCFLTNPNGLNNVGRGSTKEYFCKIILK